MQRVIERLLNLLAFLLTAERPVTADEIRQTVAGYDQDSDEAFRRTFERDKDVLRQLGIPIRLQHTDAWEVEQGYVVSPSEYALPDPGLSDEERAALWLAAQAVRLGGQAPGPGAIFKLGGAPMAGAGEPLAADLGEDADRLAEVFAAVSERRELQFTYRGAKRRLHPYGLAHRMGHWYVVGAAVGKGEQRVFRVDRMDAAVAVGDPSAFRRPGGFSVAEAIPEVPWEAGEDDIEVTVRFDPDVAWWARRQLTARARVTVDDEGALEATIPISAVDAFLGWIIGFGASAEITTPPEVRQRFVEHLSGAR
jgi:predicted DNA-binding transcriptional regulator YafY